VESGFNFLTNVGADTTINVDGCLWGLAGVLLLEILPSILSGQAATLLERISSSPEIAKDSVKEVEQYEPYYTDYSQVEGNRRLDVNEYEYIDTSPTSNHISMNVLSFPQHGEPSMEVTGLEVAPYGRGSGLQVTPIIREAEEWSEPILDNNDNNHHWSSQQKIDDNHHWSSQQKTDDNHHWSSQQKIDDDHNWSSQQNNHVWASPQNLLGEDFVQDYDDIDYTSGGLVTFHSSLS